MNPAPGNDELVPARPEPSPGPARIGGEAATWTRVIRILLRAELITQRELLCAKIEITPLSGRNGNAMVSIDKQARFVVRLSPADPGVLSPSAEAALIGYVRNDLGFAHALPRCTYRSDREHCFVLDYVQHSENLRLHWARRQRLPAFQATRLGTLLSALHGASVTPVNRLQWRAAGPSILKLRTPQASHYLDSSPAVLRTIGLLQRSTSLQQALADLENGWRPTHLCHNDIRSENLLLTRRTPSSRVSGLMLIDWELAGMGDPAWDLAGVLGEYAGYFIDSIPTSSHFPPGRFLPWASFGTRQVREMAQRFWRAYSKGGGAACEAGPAETLLRKALGFVPARLVQTAFERAQRKSSVDLANGMLLQLAENMASGKQAAEDIFGLAQRC